jgi:hypothetical protein
MRRFSHILSFVAAALFLLSIGSVAKADTVTDPAVGVQGCCDSILWPGTVTLTITNNDFTSGGFFINSGMITSFLIHSDTAFIFNSAIAGETVTPSGVAVTDATLSGFTILPQPIILLAPTALDPTAPPVITGNFAFRVLNGQGDVLTFSTPVPEPGTMILLGTGLSALGLRRLRRKARA